MVGRYHSDHGLRTLAFNRRHGMRTDLGKRGDVSGNGQRGLELWVPCRDRANRPWLLREARVALSAAAPEWSHRTNRSESSAKRCHEAVGRRR